MSHLKAFSRRALAKALGQLAAVAGGAVLTRPAAAAEAPAAALTTIGIVVADMQKSTRFYTEAFGFKALKPEPTRVTAKPGDPSANLVELDEGFDLSTQFIDAGGVQIELLAFVNPKPLGDGARGPIHRRGVNHLAIRVRDPKAIFEKVRQAGGTVLDSKPTGGATFVIDPDGTRLEIVQMR